MSSVELRNLTKVYGKSVAVAGISAHIEQGELLALLGPSGCGKTTTLRMLAGIISPDSGQVLFGDRDVTNVSPEDRDIGLVFQHYALFPHKSVADNLAFGLRMRGRDKAGRRELVNGMLDRLRLAGLGERLPAELSGGQRQRVALGRALVTRPSVLLLDEPLSNLDANLREEMRFYIRDLVTEFGITTIYVTHDQAEALAMADRIAVMMNGHIAQLADPREIYHRPNSADVASFVGVTNLLSGRVMAADDGVVTVEGPWGGVRARTATPGHSREPAVVSIRPEDISITAAGFPAPSVSGWSPADGQHAAVAEGRVEQVAYLGNTIDYRVGLADSTVRVQGTPRRLLSPGEYVRIEFSADCAWAVPGNDGSHPQGELALPEQVR